MEHCKKYALFWVNINICRFLGTYLLSWNIGQIVEFLSLKSPIESAEIH